MAHNAQVIDGIAHEAIVKGKFLKLVAGGYDLCDTLGETADAIAFSDAAAGEAVGLQIGGLVMVKVGATPVADAAALTTDANGLAITATSGDIVRCKATQAGAAGAWVEAQWFDAYEFDGT